MGSTKYPLVPPPHGGTPALPLTGQPAPLGANEFNSGSSPAVVSFGFDKVGPPAAVYIQRDDVVLFEGVSQTPGETVTLNLRLLLPSARAPLQPDHSPAGAAGAGAIIGPGYIQTITVTIQLPAALTFGFQTIPLTEGYLLSASVVCSLAAVLGLTYARAQLNRGTAQSVPGNPFTMLLGGYVTKFDPIGWPTGPFIRPSDGPGLLNAYAIGNPAAGADFLFSTPSTGRMRVAGLIATLVTSATAGNRFPSFKFTQTTIGTLQYQVQDNTAVPAATTITYSLAPGGTNVRGAGAPIFETLPMPSPIMARAGVQVGSATQGLLAGDQWSAINLYTEEWLELF
jgi:hypothetical protein